MKRVIEWLLNSHGRRARQTAGAYRQMFGSIEGKTVLRDLALYCNVGHSSFNAGDPHSTAFNEGARDVFLHIAEMSGIEPEDFPTIVKENPDG